MKPVPPTTPKPETISYKLFTQKVSAKLSPRGGLLALSRMWRSLGLPDVVNTIFPAGYYNRSGGSGPGPKSASNFIEALLLLQATGADCVQDCALLADDPCLMAGLKSSPPESAKAESFLKFWGELELDPDGHSRTHHMLRKVIDGIWKAYGKAKNFRRPEQITLDVFTLPTVRLPHVSWAQVAAPALFPTRIICLWREGDLILGGGLCRDVGALVRRLEEALATIPTDAQHGRLIRGGSVCYHPTVLTALANHKTNYEVVFGKRQARHTQAGFMISVPLAHGTVLALDQNREGWSSVGIQPSFRVEWKAYRSDNPLMSTDQLCYIAIRKSQNELGGEPFDYALIATNRDRLEGHVVNWFLRDAGTVNQAVGDIELLASGSKPGVLSELTGEGRFQLALLNYNICAAIRQLGFDRDEGNISISRMRELLFHTTGRMVKTGRQRRLKISQARSKEIFSKLNNQFQVEERARISTRKKRHSKFAPKTAAAQSPQS